MAILDEMHSIESGDGRVIGTSEGPNEDGLWVFVGDKDKPDDWSWIELTIEEAERASSLINDAVWRIKRVAAAKAKATP